MKIVPCADCPLRSLPLFLEQTPEEIALIESLKREQLVIRADSMILHEGQTNGPLYTLMQGWAFRFKTLSDGRRQILNFLLPGDFIGVQQRMADGAPHGVQALSDVLVCVFSRDALWTIHRGAPALGFDITWLTAQEESIVDDTLLSVGRRSAEERIARLLVILYKRVAALLPAGTDEGVPFPLTQQHIADGLGLSLVHTNKTLRKLEKRGLYSIRAGRLMLRDLTTLTRIADLYGDGSVSRRPLI